MNFEFAVRITEILMGMAFVQQSLEHCKYRDHRLLFLPRLLLSLLLIAGFYPAQILLLLLVMAIFILHRFQGPYNGGADRMSLLILICLCLVSYLPTLRWQEIAFGYLALQLVLSYFISGWVKLINPEWRSGKALVDVFQFSAYPVSENLRHLSQHPKLLYYASWAVILFELLFPVALSSSIGLITALIIASLFHLTNACLFGLNRFFWIWISSYPSLLWLQARITI